MKTKQVQIGGTYTAVVSGHLVNVQIIGPSIHSGWIGKNLKTGRLVRIRTARRLREKVEGDVRPPAFEDQWQALKRENPDAILLLSVGPARFITCNGDVKQIMDVCGRDVFTACTENTGLVSAASVEEITEKMAEKGQQVRICTD